MTHSSRYVHKIAPRDTDTGPQASLTKGDLTNRRALGAALRRAKILASGERLTDYRVEAGSRVVAFPAASIWHSIILEPITE